MTYNGKPLEEILINKAHPVLRPLPGRPSIGYENLMDEMDAAAVFGFEVYWNAPKEARVVMVAHVRSKRLLSSMSDYDYAQWVNANGSR